MVRLPLCACGRVGTERRSPHGSDLGAQPARPGALLSRRADHDLPGRLSADCSPVGPGRFAAHRSPVWDRGMSSRDNRIDSDGTLQEEVLHSRGLHEIRARHLGFCSPRVMAPADAHGPGPMGGAVGWELLLRDVSFILLARVGQEGSDRGRIRGLRAGLDEPKTRGSSVPLEVVRHAPGGHVEQGAPGASHPEAGPADDLVHRPRERGALDPRSVHGFRLHADRCSAPRNSGDRHRSARALLRLGRGQAAGGSAEVPTRLG